MNTRENLLFSFYALMPEVAEGKPRKLLWQQPATTCSCALPLARSLARNASGGSSEGVFCGERFIREFIGYLSMTRRRHIITLSLRARSSTLRWCFRVVDAPAGLRAWAS